MILKFSFSVTIRSILNSRFQLKIVGNQLLLLGSLVFSALVFSANSIADTRLLILGDSLSASYGMKQNEGWVHLLQQHLDSQKQDITLINASISGETSAGGLARLDSLLASKKPDYVLVELGGNDGLRGFGVKQLSDNLLKIIEKSKQHQATVWLMQVRIPPNYGQRYTTLFEAVYPKLAEQQNVKLVPFFMDQIAIQPQLMQADGIHPNRKAQNDIKDIMYQQIMALIDAPK